MFNLCYLSLKFLIKYLNDSMVKKSASLSCNTYTKYAPVPVFDYNKIPNTGIKILHEQPLVTARKIIARGLDAVKKQDTLIMKLWKRLTGLDV